MSIGYLNFETHEHTNPETGEVAEVSQLSGEIALFSVRFRIRLDEVREKPTPDSPDYIVMANKVGHWADVGAAWRRTIDRGASAGLPMFSMEFREPEIATHLKRCAAFPDRHNEGSYLIERERPRQDQGEGRAA